MKNSWTQSQDTNPLDEEITSGSSMMSMRFVFTAAVCPTRNRQPNRLRPGSQLTQMPSSESKYLASGTISRRIHSQERHVFRNSMHFVPKIGRASCRERV